MPLALSAGLGYIRSMIRTEVELSPEQYEQLRRMAEAEKLTVPEEIARLVEAGLPKRGGGAGRTIGEIAGKYPPISASSPGAADEWFAEAILDSKRRG